MNYPKVQLMIIVAAILVTYSNIYQNQFLGDDALFIKTWDEVKDLGNIPHFFAGKEFLDADIRYRPIGSTFIALHYALWKNNHTGYHISAIILHIINTLLIYSITSLLLARVKLTLIPFITALVFAVHPVNNEGVNILFTSISFGFSTYLVSFYLFVKSSLTTGRLARLCFISSLILAVLSIFSYELALSLPLIILFYLAILGKTNSKLSLYRKTLPFFLIVILYLGIRFLALDITAKAEYLTGSFYKTQLIMSIVYIKYISLILFPKVLTINHTILPGVQVWLDPFTNREAITKLSIFTPQILLNLAILATLIFLAVKTVRKRPLISFSLGWFFITLLPVSYIIPQDTIMQERYVYLASYGFILFVVLSSYYLLNLFVNSKTQFLILILAFLISVVLGYRTYLRNRDWQDQITMWSAIVANIPDHIMSRNQLASMYADNKEYDQAIKHYLKVLSLEPRIPNVYYNLGKIYQDLGDKDLAKNYYQQTLALYPDFVLAKTAIDELEGKRATWSQNEIAHKMMISYPADFSFDRIENGAVLRGDKNNFFIELTVDKKAGRMEPEAYLKTDLDTHGVLLNQGPASVPNFDKAFAKIFNDQGVQKLKLFLFKERLLIKALVYPADSDQMKVFDEMIRSILLRV